MSRDFEWIHEKLAAPIAGDPFVKKLAEISIKQQKSPFYKRKPEFVIIRNDFMFDDKRKNFYQIEYNTIATSLGSIEDRVSKSLVEISKKFGAGWDIGPNKIYETNNVDMYAEGLMETFEAYGVPDSVIFTIIDPNEVNLYDISAHEARLQEYGVEVIKVTFEEVIDNHVYDADTGMVSLYGREAAVFYLRHGYQPGHYNTEIWDMRSILECSRAIVVPSVNSHLIGSKFLQGVLNKKPEILRFGFTDQEADSLLENFAQIRVLDDFPNSSKEEMIAFIANSENFVLKPQSEGGGNNHYGAEVLEKIQEFSLETLKSYILMERIWPEVATGIFFDGENIFLDQVISEFGVYSWFLGDDTEM